MKNIFLIGFMGAGKSTVAAYLSNHFKMDVIEMDQLIAAREGMSIPDIFDKRGEEYFRNAETSLLSDIQSKANKVVSCGGGAVLREENIDIMKNAGVVVLLAAKPETILERVKDDDNRPLLQGNKNVAYIRELMEKRREKYVHAADVVVWTDGRDVQDICKEIMSYV